MEVTSTSGEATSPCSAAQPRIEEIVKISGLASFDSTTVWIQDSSGRVLQPEKS